ncbi:MAG: SpaA isopeptide-forming pilin-related protein, partial [Clostridium sp.]
MKIAKILKRKFKTLSLTLATLLTCSIVVPALPTSASVGGKVELGGLAADKWNAMTEEEREDYFDKLKATGNTGLGVMVGGWTNGAGPLMVPPITMDGNTAYCMQALRDFPVGAYYSNPSISSDTQVRSVAYHGYPNNGSGLQQKHGLSNTQAQQYTQVAIWKVLGQIGPGLAIADRTHPYVDELVSLARNGDIGPYTSMEFNLSSTTLEAHRFNEYQETDAVGTSGTPGTFTFPSNGEIWSVDVNGNAKNTFNIGESFKVRSTSNFDGLRDITINASLGNPSALVFSGTGGNQDVLQFSWGDPVASNVNMRVKFTALGTINLHKTNDKGTNLEGVKFGLYSDKEATNLLMESTTDANGNITFSDLKEGTYFVKELATLEGHVLSNEVKEVTVAAGQTNAFEWVNETI